MPSYLIIANPVAGRGSGAARAEALRALLARDHAVELVETTGRGDATLVAEERGAAWDRVVAVGGDGTLNEVLTGLLRRGRSPDARPALGFLPGGTANVATHAFGVPTEPAGLAALLGRIEGRSVDVGVAELEGTTRPFLLWCGAGVDAVVIDELNASRTGRMGITGLALKAPRVLSAVARYPAPDLHVTADDTELPPTGTVLVANVGEIAFGGTVHPDADPFDGRLDVVTTGRQGTLGILGLGTRMLRSSLTEAPGVEHRTATTVRVRSEGAVPVQVDGEPVGQLPLRIRLHPAAIRLLVDPDAARRVANRSPRPDA